jgi:hypothetical protein
MVWSRVARETIERVAATIPDETCLKARKAIIDAAYPFGPRSHWPYKAWCKARREYLARFEPGGCRKAKPTSLEHLPRDPTTGRPLIL